MLMRTTVTKISSLNYELIKLHYYTFYKIVHGLNYSYSSVTPTMKLQKDDKLINSSFSNTSNIKDFMYNIFRDIQYI